MTYSERELEFTFAKNYGTRNLRQILQVRHVRQCRAMYAAVRAAPQVAVHRCRTLQMLVLMRVGRYIMTSPTHHYFA